MATNFKGLELSDGMHLVEDVEARKRLDEIKSTEVSTTTPSSENAQVWINPDETDSFSVPEIKDGVINAVDTWSSKKINDELNSVNKCIENANKEIKNKVTLPTEVPSIGDIMRIKAINDDGTYVFEWCSEIGGGNLKDILINGESIVQDEGVANIPIANGLNGRYGLVKQGNTSNNSIIIQNGEIYNAIAYNQQISNRYYTQPLLTTKNYDYAVKCAMTDGKGEAWTQEEQAEARERIGLGDIEIDGSEKVSKESTYWVMTVTDFEKPYPFTANAICINFKPNVRFQNEWGNIIFRANSNGFVFTDLESKFTSADEVKDYFRQNNETIHYRLAEEQIIDISDIIDDIFQEPFEVEAGGTLTFQNSNGDGYRLPVPNEEEYIVSLAELGGGTDE